MPHIRRRSAMDPPDTRNHFWKDYRDEAGSPARILDGDTWARYAGRYSVPGPDGVARVRTARFFCVRCGILVPEEGPCEADADCDALVVASIMES